MWKGITNQSSIVYLAIVHLGLAPPHRPVACIPHNGRFVFGGRMGLAHPIPNCKLIIRVNYLLWQVRQIWLRALPPTGRRNVEFVLCGSWQVAHST